MIIDIHTFFLKTTHHRVKFKPIIVSKHKLMEEFEQPSMKLFQVAAYPNENQLNVKPYSTMDLANTPPMFIEPTFF